MVKVIVDIPGETFAKIEELIRRGKAKEYHSFIIVALENQLRLEETGNLQAGIANDTTVPYRRPIVSKSTLMPIPTENEVEGELIWGQYSRFLPLKVVLRIILNLNQEAYLHDVAPIITDSAIALRRRLSKKDQELHLPKGEQLAIAFPKPTEKSKLRFVHQYIGYTRSDGRKMGFGPQMRFINIINNRIGVTEYGEKFAKLENPILDNEDYTNPLSKDEVQFLLDHIKNHVKGEARHIYWMVRGLSERPMNRLQVNEHMKRFYELNNFKWSEKMIETMRAGLTSRLIEMRIVKVIRNNGYILYQLHPENRHIIDQWLSTSTIIEV